MTNLAATERIKRKLDDALDNMRGDLDRVELLAAALSAFSRPVPDYEPTIDLSRTACPAALALRSVE